MPIHQEPFLPEGHDCYRVECPAALQDLSKSGNVASTPAWSKRDAIEAGLEKRGGLLNIVEAQEIRRIRPVPRGPL